MVIQSGLDEGVLQRHLARRLAEAKSALGKLDFSNLSEFRADKAVSRLIDEFSVESPVLDWERSAAGEPVLLEDLRQYPSRKTDIMGYLFRVPFSGNREMLAVLAASETPAAPPFGGKVPLGFVDDGFFELRLSIKHGLVGLSSVFRERRGIIEASLRQLTDLVEEFNSTLSGRLRADGMKMQSMYSGALLALAELGIPVESVGSSGLEEESSGRASVSDSVEMQVRMGVPSNGSKGLRVFLCHASDDKKVVRELYQSLKDEGFKPWLDEEDLLGGQDWRNEIEKVLRSSDAVVVCLSPRMVNKSGFVQREIRLALEALTEKPEGSIYLIPAKLEECPIPGSLKGLHVIDLSEIAGFSRLRQALRLRSWQLVS